MARVWVMPLQALLACLPTLGSGRFVQLTLAAIYSQHVVTILSLLIGLF